MTEKHNSTTTQQPDQKISQVRDEIANLLGAQETTKAEAFKRLPVVMEQWAETVRQNLHVLEEIRALAEVAHVSIPFGYGLLPDLSNPVIGTTQVEI